MKSFKKINTILVLFMCAILVTTTNTYAFLSSKKTNEKNQITTGTYPKPFARIYASVGPLYKGYFSYTNGNSGINGSYESPSYEEWIKNACNYILSDIEGKTPAGTIGNGYAQFLNIPNNNTNEISQLNNIASSISKNWAGNSLQGNQPNEYGTLVHNIIAIGNPIREGVNFGKIKADESSLAITQTNIFHSKPGNLPEGKIYEYTLTNENTKVAIIKNRAVTFDYKDGKYVKTGYTVDNKYTPATEADLIIYDVGNIGFSNLSLTSKGENNLKDLGDMLTANASHATKDNPKDTKWNTKWDGQMRNIVLNQMYKNGDSYCRLDRTECTVTFKYNQYELPTQKYIINYVKNNP